MKGGFLAHLGLVACSLGANKAQIELGTDRCGVRQLVPTGSGQWAVGSGQSAVASGYGTTEEVQTAKAWLRARHAMRIDRKCRLWMQQPMGI